MYLVSANLNDIDEAQIDALTVIKTSSNAFMQECYDAQPDLASVASDARSLYGGKVVFVSHGAPDHLCGGCRRVPYCDLTTLACFQDCQILAFACYSGQILGRYAIEYAYFYIGFDATVGMPSPQSPSYRGYIKLVSQINSFFHNLQAGPVNPGTIIDFISALNADIEKEKAIYEKSDGSTLPAYDLICLKNLQNDLCFWIQGAESPLKYRGAPPLALLWT